MVGEMTGKLHACLKDGLAVLDGGFATHIEDVLKHDVSSSPLWSASLLQSKAGQDAIRQTHIDFLHAGAQIISTSTYQASLLSLRLAGVDEVTSAKLIVRSVELAEEARQEFNKSGSGEHGPSLISLSLGPYGAALANGSEYTGEYYVPLQERAATVKDMSDFHYARLRVVAESKVWEYVDLLAFETIPRLDEALAIREALQRLHDELDCERRPAYVSFVFPNGEHLPFVASGAKPSSMEEIVRATIDTFDGLGINCTKPHMLASLIQRLNAGLQTISVGRTSAKPFLFLYPDGGLVWNGQSRKWEGSSTAGQKSWSTVVLEAADCAMRSSQWAGCFVGGCCKATVDDISDLRTAIDNRSHV